MPVIPTDTVIDYAIITQYLIARDVYKKNFFFNQTTKPLHDLLLYVERKSVENAYSVDNNDATLDATNPYLLALCGAYVAEAQKIIAGDVCVAPTIVTQPTSRTVSSGTTVSFSVVASGSNPKFYQWKKDGVNISGANDATLQLTGVTAGDSGSYTVSVTNACGSVMSSAAVLTVSSLITAYYWYGDTDPYTQLSSFVDSLTYAGTVSFTSGSSISVPWPSAAGNNKFNVVRYPDSESAKTAWYNTVLNNGAIPDFVYRDILSFGGNHYIISRNAMSIDTTAPIVYS